jgi:hypothetical protein
MIKSKGHSEMNRAGGVRRIAAATSLSVLLGLFVVAIPQASAQGTCTLGQGFWKNHTSAWKLTSLELGTSYTITAAQALTILETPVAGDASLILADQLTAALLNIANGSDPTPVSATIADAQKLIGAGPLPKKIHPSSTLGQGMVKDAEILDAYNNGALTPTCGTGPPPPPPGSCQPSSSLSVLVQGSNVTAYVPKGNWGGGPTGISAVNVEGTSITPTLIPTANTANSCASNAVTGTTVCTANNTDIYLLTGTTLNNTLTSGGSGFIDFSGGACTNCGVVMDGVHNHALIALSTGASDIGGFQFLDLSTATPTLGTVFASMAPTGFETNISENVLIDPTRNTAGGAGALLLSASENNNYEIVDVTTTTSPAFFENGGIASGGALDSSGEDCSTGIALAPSEFSAPSNVFIADLKQATFTAGSPGTWTAASQVQTLSESFLAAGASGIAVAQGTHTGVVSGEFGGNAITAIVLPTTSGTGTPAIADWVTCSISSFSMGFDPHTLTAYQSPNIGPGHAIAVLTNGGATSLAVVDLTQMLNPTVVPRTVAGHGCASGTLPATVVSSVAVP